MADPANSQFAIWLTPVPTDRRWLSKVIQDYALTYSSPAFEPHVTIYSGVCSAEDNLSHILAKAAAGLQPLALEVAGLGYTENFFRTGFITFVSDGALSALSTSIGDQLHPPADYLLEPHLSLVYKDLTIEQKRLAMLRIVLSVQTITFDTLKIVRPSNEDWFDVPHWSVHGKIDLKR